MAIRLPTGNKIPKSGNLLEPYKYIKGAPVWSGEQADMLCLNMMVNNEYKYIKEELRMSIEQATADLEQLTTVFGNKLQQFNKAQTDLSEQSKKVSGQVRDSANKLHTAMQSLDKGMNLDKLERQAELLERIAIAMQSLVALEQTGTLEKVIKAMKS